MFPTPPEGVPFAALDADPLPVLLLLLFVLVYIGLTEKNEKN